MAHSSLPRTLSDRIFEPYGKIDFSEVVAALSYALDVTEGQATGHASRSCIIGMRIGRDIGLSESDLSSLFYALLLKDLGCSSNSAKVCSLFGADEHVAKCELKTTEWTSQIASIGYAAKNVAPGGSIFLKAKHFLAVARAGRKVARELVQMRCDRGAMIARNLHLAEETAQAIHSLDEHWIGTGYPDGLKGEAIPIISRIMGLAQTVEVFWQKSGKQGALDVASERASTWFDPELVRVFLTLREDAGFWESVAATDPAAAAARLEPKSLTLVADDDALDRLAMGFAQVIDAKSPWTFCHSTGVADISEGIGRVLGFEPMRLRMLRRAALLHDIGKLGVSNTILDKPGKLTAEELADMRRHPEYTFNILSRVKLFDRFAHLSASHHEKLNGQGYHQGLTAEHLSLESRILAVADIYEALAAKRPYRKDLTGEEVFTIINRDAGAGLCPVVVSALQTFIEVSHFQPYQVKAA